MFEYRGGREKSKVAHHLRHDCAKNEKKRSGNRWGGKKDILLGQGSTSVDQNRRVSGVNSERAINLRCYLIINFSNAQLFCYTYYDCFTRTCDILFIFIFLSHILIIFLFFLYNLLIIFMFRFKKHPSYDDSGSLHVE